MLPIVKSSSTRTCWSDISYGSGTFRSRWYSGLLVSCNVTGTVATSVLPTFALTLMAPTVTTPIAVSPADNFIKTKDLNSLFSRSSKDIIQAISAQPHGWVGSCDAPVHQTNCNFYSKSHYIRICDLVNNHARTDKYKRNTDSKVVLPTGAFIPHNILRTLLHNRFDKCYCRFLNQLAVPTATMLHSIVDLRTVPDVIYTHTIYQPSATNQNRGTSIICLTKHTTTTTHNLNLIPRSPYATSGTTHKHPL